MLITVGYGKILGLVYLESMIREYLKLGSSFTDELNRVKITCDFIRTSSFGEIDLYLQLWRRRICILISIVFSS